MNTPLDIQLPDSLRQAKPEEWHLVAEIIAEAFQKDPVTQWIYGDPASIRMIFEIMAHDVYSRHGVCHLAGDQGATMWMMHDATTPLHPLSIMKIGMRLLLRGNFRAMKRSLEADAAFNAHHPKAPHIYLFTIGVRKSGRGSGLGKALLAPVLSACDRAGLPCYLENSNPDNHAFYAAHGFARTGVFHAGEQGPPLTCMWRAPQ